MFPPPAHPAQLHPLVPLPAEVRALLRPQDGQLHERAGVDALIAAFMATQRVVGRRQLLACGVGSAAIQGRLDRKVLVPRFRGVYRAANPHLDLQGHRTAALLAIPDAFLSHADACGAQGIGGAGGTKWDVTVPGNGGRRTPAGFRVHTSTVLVPRDVEVVKGLPVATVPLALVDAARYLPPRILANVLAEAERRGRLHLAATREVALRVRHRPNRAYRVLNGVLGAHLALGAQVTRSEVEAAFRDIAVRAGLPAPLMNHTIAGDEIDAFWPGVGFGIEIDSWEFHGNVISFVGDKAKLRRLYLLGVHVLPYAAADVVFRSSLVVAELGALLRRAAQNRGLAA